MSSRPAASATAAEKIAGHGGSLRRRLTITG